MLDLIPAADTTRPGAHPEGAAGADDATLAPSRHPAAPAADLSRTCFYITPIGDEGSETRAHASLLDVLQELPDPIPGPPSSEVLDELRSERI